MGASKKDEGDQVEICVKFCEPHAKQRVCRSRR